MSRLVMRESHRFIAVLLNTGLMLRFHVFVHRARLHVLRCQ
jgi:hypothetical protein